MVGNLLVDSSGLVLTLLVVLASGLLHWWEAAAAVLQYERARVLSGEFWRLFTGHLVHWNGEHLFWDLAMFTSLAWLCWRYDPCRYMMCLFLSAVGISVVLLTAAPELQIYRGLSGVDTALFVLLCMQMLRELWAPQDRLLRLLAWGALGGLIAKVTFEFLTGATLFVDSNTQEFVAVPLAHLVGAIVGAVVGRIRLGGIAAESSPS